MKDGVISEAIDILYSGETIIWEGKPKFFPFIFSYLIRIKVGYVLFILLALLIFKIVDRESLNILTFLVGFGLLAAIVIYTHIKYIFTNLRVILRRARLTGKNFINYDFASIAHKDIKKVVSKKSFVDYLLGNRTGSLFIYADKKIYKEIDVGTVFEPRTWGRNEVGDKDVSLPLYNVSNPEEVLNLIQPYLKNINN